MKLSEAIRLGSLLQPQGRGGYETNKSCALQAAAQAVGIPGFSVPWDELRQEFPILSVVVPPPDQAGCQPWSSTLGLIDIIWRLNDGTPENKPWSRERIADWVETVEKQFEAGGPPPQEPDPYQRPEPIKPKVEELVAV